MAETWLLLEEKLKEINQSLSNNYKNADVFSLSRGQLGISLYFYNYYKCTLNESCFNISQEILYHSCNTLTERSTSHKLFRELIDLGRYLLLLYKDKQVDQSIIPLLDEIDDILIPFTLDKLKKNDFDPVVGAISAGYYFLEKLKYLNEESSRKILVTIVDKIKSVAVEDNAGGVYWTSNFRKENSVELGISHGVSGILLFLTRAYEARALNDKRFLIEGVNFVFGQQQDISKYSFFFPQEVGKQEKLLKVVNLAYGDLGVAYAIYEISKVICDDRLRETAIHIFKYYAKAESRIDYQVYDANLIYGSAGPAAFFRKLFAETNETLFEEAAYFWLNKTLAFLSANKNEYAGFIPYWNSVYPETLTSISEGITGIGLALLYFKDPELNFFFPVINYN
jgi:lantibiotic modifying enzyme